MSARLPHLAVWAAALLLFRLLVWPLLCMAGLDVELLVMNLYEQHAAPKELAPLAHAVLRYASAPLLIAGFASAIYGALGRRLANPLHGLSAPKRALVGLALLVPFAAAAVPLAVATALWISIEGFHWIEWQRDINPFVDGTLRVVPAVVGPGLVIGALVAIRRILGLRRRPRRGLAPLFGRAVLTAFLTATLLPTALALAAASPQASRTTNTGRAAFEAKCGGCHFRSLSLSFTKTPGEWRSTVERMAGKTGNLSPADVDAISTFLGETRSTSDYHLLRTRCLRCHGSTHTTWDARPAQQWEDLTFRMARWSPAFFPLPEQARLNAELIARYGDDAATVGESREDWDRFARLGDLCQDCHSISWNAERFRDADFDETRRMVVRMSTKLTQPLKPDEVDTFTQDYRDLMADPARFERLFPHDRPIPEPSHPDADRAQRRLSPNRGGY